jgi:hypothetical protein
MKLREFGIKYSRGHTKDVGDPRICLKAALTAYPGAVKILVNVTLHGFFLGHIQFSKTSLGWKLTIFPWQVKAAREIDYDTYFSSLTTVSKLSSTPSGGLAGLVVVE